MKSDKKIAIMVTAIIAVSVFAVIPATQAVKIISYPAPDEMWVNTDSDGDVTDVAIGVLTGNRVVAFIDNVQPSPYPHTPHRLCSPWN